MTTTGVHKTSSSISWSSYHVFLSFRGKDTRWTFIDHLYIALVNAGFRTFRDDDEIERGENIKLVLERAIKESKVSIIVFSKNYASSNWCLDELVMILERQKMGDFRHMILPVFYGVDRSQVRKQNEDYAEAFMRHKAQFKGGKSEANKWMEKLKRWRKALEEATNLPGMALHDQPDGDESKFIQNIVKAVDDKLRPTILYVPPYIIGLDSRVRMINLWLGDGGSDARIVVICGIGGIGKTIIAKFLYNLNFSKFEGSSFIANITEVSRQQNGLIHLQRELLSDILRGRNEKKINNVDEGLVKIKQVVGSKRVLIILDDVDKREQLDAVIGMQDSFSPGSKMIITTRREHLLRTHEHCMIHKVDQLNPYESLELFSWYAFGQNHPIDGYSVYSKRIVEYCNGLPLALKTLGSSMSGKSLDVWKSQLQKLKAIPDSEILKKLRLSYNSLQDDHDKNLFLDIACFFVGKDKDYAITILDGCDYFSLIGIHNLIDRNLLGVDIHNKLVMHPMIQEMGREIVRQESPQALGERSRLWKHEDSFNVLREKLGTRKIRGLTLDTHFLKEDRAKWNDFGPHGESWYNKRKRDSFSFFSSLSVGIATKTSNEVVLEVDAFVGMSNLQLLQISNVQPCGNYEKFPKGLRWLCWSGFPLQRMPDDFPLDKLVALEMPYSCLKKVWNGVKHLTLLKILNLSHSNNLSETPNFLMLPNLERLILENCARLVKVHESIGHLERLIFLSLRNCQNLRKLPEIIYKRKSLATLDISGCINLENISAELGNMDSLTVLHADGIIKSQLLCITQEVKAWPLFVWPWQSSLRSCPETSRASFPKSLVHLSLENCNLSDDCFPLEFGNLSSLRILNLSNNAMYGLPNSVRGLSRLHELYLLSCPRLKNVDCLPQNIDLLMAEGCKLLEKISFETQGMSPRLGYNGCLSLIEIKGKFKLEPLESVDGELINKFGLLDSEVVDKSPVELLSSIVAVKKRMSCPQVLHERHVLTTFMRGNKIPTSFNHKNIGTSVCFTIMPSDVYLRIQGLSVCSVVAFSNPSDALIAPSFWGDSWGLHTIISNETKYLKWSYGPAVVGIPGVDEDLLWLSYWKFEDHQLEGGDVLNISVPTTEAFQVKEVGVRLVYREEAKEQKSNQATNSDDARPIHSLYGKAVPSCCNEDCQKCKNYPVPTNPASTRVILVGTHPWYCTGCPDGYSVDHYMTRTG
ncbi:disease resistance protein RPV1-like isoform X2 [Diospyros lotus]|uniref:disease resistance protein RPV1-like isoform X2 n=1 Tax=Diospyros lotus TaxID=55363 RepID=UPI00225371A4|nr:disease resistance protein RPV1-like isoform X2 [Diospyros lotus]